MKIYCLFKHALNVFLNKNCLNISSFMLKMRKRRKIFHCNVIILNCVHLGQNGNYKIIYTYRYIWQRKQRIKQKNDDIPFKGPLNEFTVINIDTFIPVIFFYIEVIPRSAFDRIVSLRKLILLFIFKVIRKNQFRSLYNHINFNWHIFTPNTHMTSFVFKCEGQIAIDSRLRL